MRRLQESYTVYFAQKLSKQLRYVHILIKTIRNQNSQLTWNPNPDRHEKSILDFSLANYLDNHDSVQFFWPVHAFLLVFVDYPCVKWAEVDWSWCTCWLSMSSTYKDHVVALALSPWGLPISLLIIMMKPRLSRHYLKQRYIVFRIIIGARCLKTTEKVSLKAFRVAKCSLKIPKIVKFGEFLKIKYLGSIRHFG